MKKKNFQSCRTFTSYAKLVHHYTYPSRPPDCPTPPLSPTCSERLCNTLVCGYFFAHSLVFTKPHPHTSTHTSTTNISRTPTVYSCMIITFELHNSHPTHTHSPYWKRVGSYYIRRSLRGSCSQIRKDWGKVQICVVILCVWVYVGVWVCKSQNFHV